MFFAVHISPQIKSLLFRGWRGRSIPGLVRATSAMTSRGGKPCRWVVYAYSHILVVWQTGSTCSWSKQCPAIGASCHFSEHKYGSCSIHS